MLTNTHKQALDKPDIHIIQIFLKENEKTSLYCCCFVFSRSVRLRQNLVIGAGTVIQDETEITHSVVGRNCKIGKLMVDSNMPNEKIYLLM
jgi:NDP-sugar pyrophosphorylase family protein